MPDEYKDVILIVDDTPQNLQVLGQTLESNGYQVVIAQSGEQALEFTDSTVPDLILLDIIMPGLDGYETCRKFKEDHLVVDVPVIFLTAKTESDDILRGFDAGGVDYVTKPFNTAELLARVRTHLELKHAREEIKTLRGMVPVCSSCKSIRDTDGSWMEFEQYIEKYSEAMLTHTMCPDCVKKHYPEIADEVLSG